MHTSLRVMRGLGIYVLSCDHLAEKHREDPQMLAVDSCILIDSVFIEDLYLEVVYLVGEQGTLVVLIGLLKTDYI